MKRLGILLFGILLVGNKVYSSDQFLDIAIAEIESTYGDVVSVEAKKKTLLKFGQTTNADSAAKTTIATLPSTITNETLVTNNSIAYVSSGSTSDTNKTVTYEAHYYDSNSGNYFFKVSSVTLQGQTKTPLPLGVSRISRAKNTGSTALVGPIYFYEDDTVSSGAPQTAAKTHLIIAAGHDQSEKAATTISGTDYYIITQLYVAGSRGNSNVKLDYAIEVKEPGQVFRPRFEGSLTASKASELIDLKPYVLVPKNSDVRLVVTSDTDNSTVIGWFNGVLAQVVTK